jgi:opacity protein-like surface antigen
LAVILVALSALPARAEGFFVPYIGFNYGGNSSNCASFNNCEDKHTNFGVAFGGMGKVIGFEQDIAYAKDFFGKVPGADNSVFTFMSNMLIGVGTGPVRPYGVFGFGLIRPHTSLNIASTVTDFSKNAWGYAVGGGVTGYFSRHVGIRGDIRRMQTLQDVTILGSLTGTILVNQKLDFWRASIGLALH